MWVAAAAAWALLAAGALAGGGGVEVGPAHHGHLHPTPGTGGSSLRASVPESVPVWSAWWAWTVGWVLMVMAMMWPLLAPMAGAIARRPRRRRWQVAAVVTFVAAVTMLWLGAGAAGALLHAAVDATVDGVVGLAAPDAADASSAGAGPWWAVGWLLIAALATRWHWRAARLRTCAPIGVIALGGARTLRSAVRQANRSWPTCAVLCAPVMAAMVGPHPPWLVVPTSVAVWREQRHPMRLRDPIPVMLLVGAAALTAVLR